MTDDDRRSRMPTAHAGARDRLAMLGIAIASAMVISAVLFFAGAFTRSTG